MSEDTIYLDHNATTPVLPEAVDAMLPYLRERFGNPSSGHAFGRAAREAVENVASIVGLGVACDRAASDLEIEGARVRVLRDDLWERLRATVPGLALNGHPIERLPNTLNVRFPGVSGTAVLEGASGVAASTGSACHAGHEEAPAVVVAMGVPQQEALGSVRLTLGRGTTAEDIARAAASLAAAWHSLAGRRSET
jgi:cysteine desulfurase